MLEKSFGLFFFLKATKNQKSDERYIYLRITVDGIAKELSTKRMWNVSRWDQGLGRAKGNKEDALTLNAYLDILRANVYSTKSQLMLSGKDVTAELLKNYLTGNGEEKRMLLEIFTKYNAEILALVGKDYAYRTYQRYRTTYDHTAAFIKWKYEKDDIVEILMNVTTPFRRKVKGLYIHNDVIYFQLGLENSSAIDYDVQSLRFFIHDKKRSKRTASQEVELQPLYILGNTNVIRHASEQTVCFALPKFTIPDKKYLSLQLMEKNGGRHLSIKISNKMLVHSKSLL